MLQLSNISISDGVSTLIMPVSRKVSVGGTDVCKEIEMASGKLVREMKGHRVKVTAEWDWLPVDVLTDLHTMLRRGGYFTVTYPDPAQGMTTASFAIAYPTSKIFRFGSNGEPRWHEVTLAMTAQEVI